MAARKSKRGTGAEAPDGDQEAAAAVVGPADESPAPPADVQAAMPNTHALAARRQRIGEIDGELAGLEAEFGRVQQARAERIASLDDDDGPDDRDAVPRLEAAIGDRRRALEILQRQCRALEPLAGREATEAADRQRLAAERELAEAMRRMIPHLCAAMRELVVATPTAALTRTLGANHEVGEAWREAARKLDPQLLATRIEARVVERLANIERASTRARLRARVPDDTLIYALRGFRYVNATDPEHGERQVNAGAICYVPQLIAESAITQKLAQRVPPPVGQMRIETLRDVTTSDGRRIARDWPVTLPSHEAQALMATGAVRPRTALTRDEIAAYRSGGYPEREREFAYGVDLGRIEADGSLAAPQPRPNGAQQGSAAAA